MLPVALLSLLTSAIALLLAALAWRATRSGGDADALPGDVLGLRQEVAALRAEASGALRHLGLVRYDAFPDAGGRLSWSLVLADDAGDGILLTSIHGRSEARSYAKTISDWSCEQPLSPEETEALNTARRG